VICEVHDPFDPDADWTPVEADTPEAAALAYLVQRHEASDVRRTEFTVRVREDRERSPVRVRVRVVPARFEVQS
jgi:hypothetical protein